MTSDEEQSYIQGKRAAWLFLLRMALVELHLQRDSGNADVLLAEALLELEETRGALRRACAEHGDNDWPDDLHLVDVIEKHLVRHLEAS